MIYKAFRALERSWLASNIKERELLEVDYCFLLNCFKSKTLKDKLPDSVQLYCASFDILHKSLLRGSFEDNITEDDTNLQQSSVKKRKATRVPAVSSEKSLDWLNRGLEAAFASDEFIEIFFDDLAKQVYTHAVTQPEMFGVVVQIPTDDSITAALNQLPPGYREVLLRLQNHIGANVCLDLFFFAMEHADEMGGPGSAVRLVIDMIESQLFNTTAIANNVGFGEVQMKDGTVTTKFAFLTEIITKSLGPFPFNMAFGPILQHILYVEAAKGQTTCIDYFLGHCASEDGFSAHPIHRMGLLTIIGSFILNPVAATKCIRPDGLFCRSQIPDERVWKQYPLETIRRIFNTICALEKFDDFVILAFAAATELIQEHGSALMSLQDVRRLYDVLCSNPDNMQDLLNDETDTASYETLLHVCKQILNI